MNILNFVFIGLIFLSLAVIVFIFGKNIKRIKEISARNPEMFFKEDEKKKGIISRILGYLLKTFKNFFVCFAEWIIKYAKKLLHMVHFWLIMLKREKKGDEDIDEREAKEELLNEEQKNLNTLIHDGLGSEDDGIEANFVSKSLEIEVTHKTGREEFSVRKEQQIVEEEVAMPQESQIEEGGFEESQAKEKENKVRRFFSRKKKAEQEQEWEEAVIEEQADGQEQRFFSEFQEFDQEEGEQQNEQGFFKKVFSRFSKKTEKQNGEDVYDYNKSFSEEEFSDGVVKIQNSDIRETKSGNFVEGVVSPVGFGQEIDIDDDLGVDRKILEKKILQKITRNPKNIENYRQLGELYIKMKNYQDAADAYKYILQVSPRDVDAKRKIEKVKLLKRIN